MTSDVLELDRFGVGFGDRVILARVDLVVPRTGVVTLMGPGGAGKSTLVRTLAGMNDGEPTLRTWGFARYGDAAWRSIAGPELVAQSLQQLAVTVFESIVSAFRDRSRLDRPAQLDRVHGLLARLGVDELEAKLHVCVIELPRVDRRLVAMVRCAAADPRLLMLDEPTAGLSDRDRERILEPIRRWAATRAALVVTHNRQDAYALGGSTALLAGGEILEHAPTARFFLAPETAAARAYVETGGCGVASPGPLVPLDDGEESDDDEAALPSLSLRTPRSTPPLRIRWIEDGVLAGVNRPGLLRPVEEDLRALQASGIRVLVCLEESQPVTQAQLTSFGIESLALPIVDMDVPTVEEAATLCGAIDEAVEVGHPVAIHCRAGLGRTGTVLGAFLIWSGATPEEALRRLRAVEVRFVQSERQMEFLFQFAIELAGALPSASSAVPTQSSH